MDPQNPSTRSSTSDRSPATAAVDGIFRRLLKISNPGNPDEVAKGLLARYGDEARRIKREQQVCHSRSRRRRPRPPRRRPAVARPTSRRPRTR
jgi:hypothetical protein